MLLCRISCQSISYWKIESTDASRLENNVRITHCAVLPALIRVVIGIDYALHAIKILIHFTIDLYTDVKMQVSKDIHCFA